MRVGLVAATKFPERKIRDRVAKNTEHTLVIRPRDHFLANILGEHEVWEPEFDWLGGVAALNSFFRSVDHLMVFHVKGAVATEFFAKKLADQTYSLIYEPKVTLIEHKRRA